VNKATFLLSSLTLIVCCSGLAQELDDNHTASPAAPSARRPSSGTQVDDGELSRGIGLGIGQAIGEVIGEQIRHEIVKNMTPRDRQAYLNAQRMALRADLLWKYAFTEKESSFKGYVMARREGRTKDGSYCREYESDLILNLMRQYFVSTACWQNNQWITVNPSQVIFSSNSTGGSHSLPGSPADSGGEWLPPVDGNP
jgi:surface antigen